jgi:carbonic anhydrase/acetyltransferase-like protein (isoleucine patch superfamily)
VFRKSLNTKRAEVSQRTTRDNSMIVPFDNRSPLVHPTAFVAENAMVIGDVEIGEDSSVWFGSVIRGDVNYIRIGARTNIQDHTIIHVNTGTHPTILEDEITVGHRVTLHGCYVESGCLVGIGSIVLDGARIGAKSLIAAGSLVTPNTQIPPRSMVMGAPARVKRELTDDELAGMSRNWQSYIDLKDQYLDPLTV